MKKHGGKIIRRYGKYQVINCRNCKFIHINPVPSNEELQSFYENEYYQKTKPDYITGNEKDIEYQNYTFDEKLDFLEKNNSKKNKKNSRYRFRPRIFFKKSKKERMECFRN